MEQNKLLHKPFMQIFHITDITHNILGLPFIIKYIPTINNLNSKLHITDKYTKLNFTSPTFFQSMNRQPPIFSELNPINNQQRIHQKPLTRNVDDISKNQTHQNNPDLNKQKLKMSELELKPLHNLGRVTISSIKHAKSTNTHILSLHVYNNSPSKTTFPLEILGNCETNTTQNSTNTKFRKKNGFEPKIQNSKCTTQKIKVLAMFNYQHSQINQQEFEKLAIL